MGLLDTWLAIQTNKALSSDIEQQIIFNQESIDRLHRIESSEISDINAKADSERALIDNKISEAESNEKSGKITLDEYYNIVNEARSNKNEITNKEERQTENIEQTTNDKTTPIEKQNDILQAQNEALTEDNKGLEENRSSDIENSFGYLN